MKVFLVMIGGWSVQGLLVGQRDGLRALVDEVPSKLREVLALIGQERRAPVAAMILIIIGGADIHVPVAVFVDLQAHGLPGEVVAGLIEFRAVEVAAKVFPVGEEFGADVGDAGEADFASFHDVKRFVLGVTVGDRLLSEAGELREDG